MRKLLITTFITLDGVMQAPGGPEEDPTGGFTLGGWLFNYGDDTLGKALKETMGQSFDVLIGRKTYEIFAAYWPYKKDWPADQLNSARKYVVSRTLDRVDWNNSTLIKNNVPEEIRKLKEQEGPEIQVHGSGNLLQTLLKNNLIDEYRIMIFPLVIGHGKRLFGKGTIPANLKLTDSTISSTGVIILKYQPDGDVKPSSYPIEKPSEAEIVRRKKLMEENSNDEITI